MFGIPIILCSCLFLSACNGSTTGEMSDSNSISEFGENTATSSEATDWIGALEEWDDSSKGDDNTSNSTTTSNSKDSYENGGGWTQGWY